MKSIFLAAFLFADVCFSGDWWFPEEKRPLCLNIDDCKALISRVEKRIEQLSQPIVTSVNGSLFTRIMNHPELGEAWKDPSGRIWGSFATDANGKLLEMTKDEAQEYCESRGAFLPHEDSYKSLFDTYLAYHYVTTVNGSSVRTWKYFPEIMPYGKSWISNRQKSVRNNYDYGYFDAIADSENGSFSTVDTLVAKKFAVRCMLYSP